MSETTSRLGHAIRDLLLACLNATLILVIVALVLGLRFLGTVERIGDEFSVQLLRLDPVQEELQAIRSEMSGVRENFGNVSQQLAAIKDSPDLIKTELLASLEPRLQELEAKFTALDVRMTETRAALGETFESPEALIDHAIGSAAEQLGGVITNVRGCAPAGS